MSGLTQAHIENGLGVLRGANGLTLGHGGQGVGVQGSATLLWEGSAAGRRRLVFLKNINLFILIGG